MNFRNKGPNIMQVQNISFGKVITVSGAPKRIKNIEQRLAGSGQVMIKDVTDHYKSAMPTGEIAKAAQKGNKIKLFLTGADKKAVEKSEPGWKSINEMLSHMQQYFDANRFSTAQIVEAVLQK